MRTEAQNLDQDHSLIGPCFSEWTQMFLIHRLLSPGERHIIAHQVTLSLSHRQELDLEFNRQSNFNQFGQYSGHASLHATESYTQQSPIQMTRRNISSRQIKEKKVERKKEETFNSQ